jgi:hypothetical protein
MFDSFWFLGLACILSILASVAGLWLVRRNVSHEILMGHHDVAGSMLSIIGTLYAVVLGLVVVGSLSKFDQARSVVESEANSLRDIFSLSSGLPAQLGTKMRRNCLDYATIVSGEEWSLLAEGRHSKRAGEIYESLNNEVVRFRPVGDGESNLQQSLLSQVNELGDKRTVRLALASPSFHPVIWSVLISGGAVLVAFTYFFGVKNFKLQVLMTVLVSTVLALNMVIVAMFAYPFSGDVRVWPATFQTDLGFFQQELGRKAPSPGITPAQ